MASLVVSLHEQGGRQSPDLLQHINTQTCSHYVEDTWVKARELEPFIEHNSIDGNTSSAQPFNGGNCHMLTILTQTR